ncbi:AsmA family protein [Breoghania sp. JC706]|uniref:AsmA family protein n=1 Tax=Breoghania sp. JC706 TaxID=3117732 RepID=UPI00300864F7
MKRWLIAASLVIMVIAAFFAALPLLVSTEIAKERIAAVLSDWLGADVEVGGRPHVTFAAGLSVVLPDVRAHNAREKMSAHFDAVEAEVRWLPLLKGQIVLSRFLLDKPKIVAEAGSSVFAISALRKDPSQWPFAANDLRIRDGSFTILAPGRRPEHVTAINGTLTWPGARGEAALSASFIWHEEPVELRAGLSDTAVFGGQGKASLNLSVTSTPLRADFEGVLVGPGNLQANGKASVTVPNLRRLMTWTGRSPGEGATLGPFQLDCEARANADGVVLDQATVELDGNVGKGLLAFDWRGERPSLQGTLDFEKLDLSGYFSEWLRAAGMDETERYTVPVAELAAADIDVQLSARQVRIGVARIGQTAASFLIREGNMALEIGEAVLYGGSIAARLSATVEHQDGAQTGAVKSVQVTGDMTARHIDLGALPLDTWKARPVAGTAEGTLALSATGRDLAALAETARGRLDVTADGLVLSGFDLAKAIDTFTAQARTPEDSANDSDATQHAPDAATTPGSGKAAADAPTPAALPETGSDGGRTTFDKMRIAATIADGIATFTRAEATSGDLSVSADGRASLPEWTIGLTGLATHKATPPAAIPFLVRGPLAAPQFLPDVNRMIEEKKDAATQEAEQPVR